MSFAPGARMNPRRMSLWAQVFVASAIVRILVALACNQPNLSIDASGYDVMAGNLLAWGTLSEKAEAPLVPSGYREPGYPAFVAACYWLIGVHPMGAVIIQSILGAVGTVFFILCVIRLSGRDDAWLAWISALVSLATPWMSSAGWVELMREDLSHTLLLGVILLADRLIRRDHIRRPYAAALGAWIGVGALIKATFVVVLPAILIVWLAKSRRKAVLPAILALLATGAVVAPWLARNYFLFGQPDLACTKGLILYQHSGRPDQLDGVEPEYRQLAHELANRWPDARPYSSLAKYKMETQDGWTHFCHVFHYAIVARDKRSPEDADAILYRIAKQDALEDPGRYLAITASNISFYLTGGLVGGRARPAEIVAERGPFRRLFYTLRPAAILALEALAVAGLLLFGRAPLAWMLMLTAAGTILANSVVSAGHWRYRTTADVLWAVLAMAVLARLIEHYTGKPPHTTTSGRGIESLPQ